MSSRSGGRGFAERLAGRVTLLEGWRRVLLTLFAGALATLALPPFNFPAVGFVSFPLLVWLLDGALPAPGAGLFRRLLPSFATGWLFGFGYFVAGLWWLGAALMVDAGSFALFIPFAVLGLPAVLAVFYGFAGVLARALWGDNAFRLFSLAGAFALAEMGRGILFTGFPWNEIGLMAAPVPLAMQTTALVGLHGLTLLAVFVFAAPAALADRRGVRPVIALAVVLALFHLGFGAWRLSAYETRFADGVALRVVQPSIPQTLKWDEAVAVEIFEKHLALTQTRRPVPGLDAPAARTLVIWPESAFPFLLSERPDAVARLDDALQPGETLLAGAARVEGDPATGLAYNSSVVIDDTGATIETRDKVHLVPFGEYLPYREFLSGLGLRQVTEMPGGFSAGTERARVPLDGAPSFLPLICYEIIFPGEIAVGGSENRPGFLLNQTNDAWYGRTPGPYQHLRQAELAAVSLGLPLVRAANNGVSVVSDAYGRRVGGLALDAVGTIDARLPEAAPATLFARFRYAPFWTMFAMTWAGSVVGLRFLRP